MKIKLLISLVTPLLSLSTYALNDADSGLTRIQSNIENAKSNLGQYEKNMSTIDSNLQTLKQAEGQILHQKEILYTAIKKNKDGQNKLKSQENELNKLIEGEKRDITKDDVQLKELQALIVKIQANQQKRTENIANYQQQIQQLGTEKKGWDEKSVDLGKYKTEIDKELEQIIKEQKTWASKKSGYKSEISKWNKEINKQQKAYDDLKALAQAQE